MWKILKNISVSAENKIKHFYYFTLKQQAAPGDWNNEPAPGMNLGETPVPVAGAPEAAAAVAEGEAPVDDWAAQSTQAQKEQTGDWGENVEGSW